MNDWTGHQHVPPGAVVVGFDEHPVAQRALDWAADHAARSTRPLVVLHATGPVGSVGATALSLADPAYEPTATSVEQHGLAVVARAVARAGLRHPDLSIIPVVAVDEPGPELLHLGRTAHLVVVGSRGHGLSRAIPSGQVGTWLARRTSGPIVVVPDRDPEVVRQGVLVGLPAVEDAGPVLDFAYRHASLHGLALTVVHATRDASVTSEADRRRWLVEAMSGRRERYPDVPVGLEMIPGRPVRTLLRMADRMDLLVVGQHTHDPYDRPAGHVRGSIVDRSPCPTAVVPATVTAPA